MHLTDEGLATVEVLAAQVRRLEAHVFGHLGDERRTAALGRRAERLRALIGELTASDLSFVLIAEPGQRPDGEEV